AAPAWGAYGLVVPASPPVSPPLSLFPVSAGAVGAGTLMLTSAVVSVPIWVNAQIAIRMTMIPMIHGHGLWLRESVTLIWSAMSLLLVWVPRGTLAEPMSLPGEGRRCRSGPHSRGHPQSLRQDSPMNRPATFCCLGLLALAGRGDHDATGPE